METAPPIMFAGFLPSASLVESLVHISNEVASMDKLSFLQSRNSASMIRRIKLLSSLFDEIRDMNTALPPSSILCFTELFSTIRRSKLLIQECKAASALWSLVQTEFIAEQFHLLEKEMGRALDILPLSLLNLTTDVREQVELLHRQTRKAQLLVEPRDGRRREGLLQVMDNNRSNNNYNKNSIDCQKLEEIMCSLGLRSSTDYDDEISKLEAEIRKQAGTGGVVVVSNLNNLISLVSYSKSAILGEGGGNNEQVKQGKEQGLSVQESSSSQSFVVKNIVDEFRCPISLDLMRDPVIVASGHTYDRSSIIRWIDSGHHTCPKSGQKLIHMALIPNYALKSLILQWCQDNDVQLIDNYLPLPSPDSDEDSFYQKPSLGKAVDHISAVKTAVEAVKMMADFLVGKLATGSMEIRRHAAFEARLLAKSGMDNRRIIAESGAIPFLVTLLTANDPRTQENAVTALLNLSILDNNKVLIMEAGAIDGIIEVLQVGKSMEARENAAATIFSLSMIDECKLMIGAHPLAIPALVGLLKEGTSVGKRDASMALYNLAIYNANKVSIVAADAVPLLVQLLMDDKARITDNALAVLALLSGCTEGLKEIRENRAAVSLFVDLMRFGSAKGKENSVALLSGMCRNGGEEIARRLLINPTSIPSLQSLVSEGSPKAKRKAEALLRLLDRYCSQSQISQCSNE
ncbi:hypothetical protein AAC387_Pa01g4190 [Persea americana]